MGIVLGIIVIILSVVIDLVTKAAVAGNMEVGQTIPIIKDVLHITYTQNNGAAFSILKDQMLFFYIITPIAIAIFACYLFKVRNGGKFQIITLGLIIGGTIGNFIDRIFLRYVRDFIDVRLIDFAIFNFADMCLTVGVLMFVIYLLIDLFKDRKKAEKDVGSKEDN